MSAPLQQPPVRAFTIGFDHAIYDEALVAWEMAERAGAHHEILELSADDLYGSHFATVVWHAERTFYNTLSVAKWHMSRRMRELGLKVVVTGEGSDELFGGYSFLERDMFLHGGPGEGRHRGGLEERDGVFRGTILAERGASHPAFEQLCGFTPSWIQPWILTLERVRPLLSPRLREELRGYDPVAAIAATIDPERVRGRHPLDIAQYTWSKTMLEGQILTWGGDRVDMANSLESRPAFLDHHLAECAPGSHRGCASATAWRSGSCGRQCGASRPPLPAREVPVHGAAGAHRHGHEGRRRRARDTLDVARADRRGGPRRRRRVQGVVDALHAGGAGPDAANRDDVVVDHLLGLHILDQVAAAPVPAGA